MSRSPILYKVKEKAVHKTKKGPRGGKVYICKKCKATFPGKDVQVDHIKVVVPLNKTIHDMSYDEIVKRMFCPISNLQVLCKSCHSKKTTHERKERTKWKQSLK